MTNGWKYLSQKGSMMVEALAMLGLITMVTPVLYKKAAERTTELQDINTATQMRTLSKALDDFIRDNYNDLADGPDGETEIDRAEIEPYLPYNFNLDNSRLFDDFQFAIRNEKINLGTDKEHSAITGVVLAKTASELPILRASKIASMVGANGGVVRSQEIQGVQGGWNANLEDFFADAEVPDGSLATSSVHAITSAGGGADSNHVLYRDDSKGDITYNTMQTTLYMGGENIEDVSKIVASSEAGRDGTEAGAVTVDGKLISTGDLDVAGAAVIDGNTTVGGALEAQSATIYGNLKAGDTTVATLLSEGVANIGGLLTAKNGAVVETGGLDVKEGGALISGKTTESDEVNSEYSLVTNGNLLVKNNVHVVGSMKIDTDLIAENLFGINSIGGGQLSDGTYNFLADDTKVTVVGNDFVVGEGSANPRISSSDTQVDLNSDNYKVSVLNDGVVAMNHEETAGFAVIRGVSLLMGEMAMMRDSTLSNDVTVRSDAVEITSNNKVVATGANGGMQLDSNGAKVGYYNNGSFSGPNVSLAADGAFLVGAKGATGVRTPEISLEEGNINAEADVFSVDANNIKIDESNIVLDDSAEIPGSEDSSNYANRSSGVRINREGLIQLPAASGTRDGFSRADVGTGEGQQDVPGYIKLDRVLANQAFPDNLGSGNQYSLHIKADGNTASHPYDAYQVNPAYTSVMHDIKLTTRGGARLSDILPDFINKGIYVLDNTYQEEKGKESWENYTVSVNKPGFVNNPPADCTSADCIATPWLGFVPTPQCPPGYSKVITISPIRWKMSEAYYIPGAKPVAGDVADKFRAYFIPPTDPTTAHFELAEADGSSGTHTHTLADGSGYPLTFQTNTWLNTTVSGVKGDGGSAEASGDQGPGRYGTFVGWHAIMGFLYYAQDYKEYLTELGQGSLAAQNVVVWNLFPVYNEEMTAIANVYCYFERRDISETPSWSWDGDYVDTGYDQLTKFRFGFQKNNSNYYKRLNDPALDYDEVW